MALPIFSLIGIFGKVMDFAKMLMGFLDRRKAHKAGRDGVLLEAERETADVVARNLEGQNSVDQMTEAELDDFLKKP